MTFRMRLGAGDGTPRGETLSACPWRDSTVESSVIQPPGAVGFPAAVLSTKKTLISLYVSLHFTEAQFPAKGTFPNPQHHLPGLQGETGSILRPQRLAGWREKSQAGGPLRKSLCCLRLFGGSWGWSRAAGIAATGSG